MRVEEVRDQKWGTMLRLGVCGDGPLSSLCRVLVVGHVWRKSGSGGGASQLERLASRGPSSPARRVHNH